ncbi:acyltransferase [Desulfotalea psychrophila]|uniref:Related to galactoside O-acetyltransferase n=1 Tax=Desulfotalea psychrophila (strain LSv54 / DSM 12343) TaxID=177439 RepID=Q6AS98_DESPS|nr:acyltransferase [Desulfotalea psychrophila]CAG34765.1 related to galactoside O-acetyltransferase [Desulfotalea psychrophila LSv54]
MNYLFLFFYYSFLIYLPSVSFVSFGVFLRRLVVAHIFKYVGKNVNIAKGVYFGRGHNITIGENSGIGENSRIVCMEKVEIGCDVMIGPEVMMLTGGHGYTDTKLLLREQDIITAPIKIGNDCWIGARAIILPGITITDRVIIGAGSVVAKSIFESGIYVGNPASKIRNL